jgi:alpha-glucosidase
MIGATDDLLIYRRRHSSASVLVILNLSADPVSLASDGIKGEILLSTLMDRTGEKVAGSLDLRGNEGVIASCPAPKSAMDRVKSPGRSEPLA